MLAFFWADVALWPVASFAAAHKILSLLEAQMG